MSSQRGKHKEDDQWFSDIWRPLLKEAVDDHSYLLSRGYPVQAAMALVGNRYHLTQRQRMAVQRMSASAQAIANRKRRGCHISTLARQAVDIDGFNLLILVECVMSGAYVLRCRDGVYRGIASVRGAYKRIIETEGAIKLIGNTLKQLQVSDKDGY